MQETTKSLLEVLIDDNRSTYLFFGKQGPKFKHFISCKDGSIQVIRLSSSEMRNRRLASLDSPTQTPEHFAEVYIKSHLTKSREALEILYGVLGQEVPDLAQNRSLKRGLEGHGPLGDMVSLPLICERENLDPSKARKFLRKAGKKPGGRWEWPVAEVSGITEYLKKCLL